MKLPATVNLPNFLSSLRIILTPFFLWLWLRGDSFTTAFILLCCIGLTDFLDGTAARYLGQVTRLGMILDPLADKLFLVSSMIVLIFRNEHLLWPVAIIIGRDILVVTAFFYLQTTKSGEPVKTNATGKTAAALQVLAVVAAFAMPAWNLPESYAAVPVALLWTAAGLALVSAAMYAGKSRVPT